MAAVITEETMGAAMMVAEMLAVKAVKAAKAARVAMMIDRGLES